ncbi:lytic transglycosylase domain-containing protein [Conexibacter sp. SYSU D00693]|uniref:lytic transglycosylase domain-containing protein n=1 Tax=Conexibacter sp. SYSU D00693 TaxID=2812560 RepID=UPI00196AE97A|nr:lytic transglycosylase domain-containing protein [Conexibacter sp. SYSU D00693]
MSARAPARSAPSRSPSRPAAKRGGSSARARAAKRKRAAQRRRRLTAILVAGLAVVAAMTLARPFFDDAVKQVTLPLTHEDIIRQQAREKDLDPALIAAVIFAESRFVEGRTSHAGAEGLMQVTPDTARDIARRSGATTFQVEDLHTPQVNIAYGSFHLRYLLDRFGDNTMLALAAYNGGEGNVDRWIAEHRGQGQDLDAQDIPFPETREYVQKVLDARRDYRTQYRSELGL